MWPEYFLSSPLLNSNGVYNGKKEARFALDTFSNFFWQWTNHCKVNWEQGETLGQMNHKNNICAPLLQDTGISSCTDEIWRNGVKDAHICLRKLVNIHIFSPRIIRTRWNALNLYIPWFKIILKSFPCVKATKNYASWNVSLSCSRGQFRKIDCEPISERCKSWT